MNESFRKRLKEYEGKLERELRKELDIERTLKNLREGSGESSREKEHAKSINWEEEELCPAGACS